MYKFILIVLSVMLSVSVYALKFPDCSNYKIEKVSLTDSGYIAVWMSNSCADCNSDINGCVYAEMKIINRFVSSDTIGATNCNCLLSPPNGGQRLYLVPSTISILPEIDKMRFYFACDHPYCEDIEISDSALNINKPTLKSQFKIYPNPTREIVNLEYEANVKVQSIQMVDMSGRVIKSFKKNENVLNVSGLVSGIYFLHIQTEKGSVTEKIVVE